MLDLIRLSIWDWLSLDLLLEISVLNNKKSSIAGGLGYNLLLCCSLGEVKVNLDTPQYRENKENPFFLWNIKNTPGGVVWCGCEGENPGVAMLPNDQLSINICLSQPQSHYNCYGSLLASLLPAHHHYYPVSPQHCKLNRFNHLIIYIDLMGNGKAQVKMF